MFFKKRDKLFTSNFRVLKKQKKLPNFSEKSSQKLSNHFEDDMYLIWQEFGNFDNVISLNRRDLIKSFGEERYLALNYNSDDFFRDSDFSLSLICSNKEIAIIGFFISENKTINIVQLQGQKGFELDKSFFQDWKSFLINELKIFVKDLGFEYLRILRAEDNYLFKFPRKVDEGFNLEEHQKRLLYIYNVLPTRKWGFKYQKGERFSILKL